MSDAIVVINAGSSSVKFALFAADGEPSAASRICEGEYDGIGHQVGFVARDGNGQVLDRLSLAHNDHADVLQGLLAWIGRRFPDRDIVAAGHRIVHGGAEHTRPTRLDDDTVDALRALIPLAPLHQPHHLEAIDILRRLHPDLLQVGCFDTAFHDTQTELVKRYALPQSLYDEGVRRYGFHGLSYEYIASILPEVIGAAAAEGRVVVAHLGHGASLCALQARRSVATTMGFTALDGVPMGRRCGALDPGVILYLLQHKGMDADAVSDLLYRRSGLYGVSGLSDDMRTLLDSDEPAAQLAVDMFAYRIARELGSLAAALGGLDALVFTAGIGEHAAEVRRRVLGYSAWLGLDLDAQANRSGGPRLTRSGSRASAWVIATDEDLMIARHTWQWLRGEPD